MTSAPGGHRWPTTQRLGQTTWQNSDSAAWRGPQLMPVPQQTPCHRENPVKSGFIAIQRLRIPGNWCPLRQIFPPTGEPVGLHCPRLSCMLGETAGDLLKQKAGLREFWEAHMSQQFASRPLVIAPSILAADFAKL